VGRQALRPQNIKSGDLYGRGLLAGPRFSQVRSSTRYSGLECFDNSVTRQEVAFWHTFPLGNNLNYTNGAGTKVILSQPRLFIITRIVKLNAILQ
jgi:hypothetical protein